MNIIKIYTLIGCLVFSIATAYGAGNADSLYKVLKIKKRGGTMLYMLDETIHYLK